MNRLALLNLWLLIAVGVRADEFAAGVAAAQAGNFSEARAVFQKHIQAHPSSGALVNLGVVEWQSGRAGAAIVAWERAVWIDPRDERARQNLQLARSVAQVEAPELSWLEKISTWLAPNAWVWLAGASLWLALGALVLPRLLRWPRQGWQPWLAALGLGAFLLALAGNWGVVKRTDIGIIIRRDVPLRLTPTSGGEIFSTLPAGQAVRRLQARGEFILIRTPLATGWVERGQAEFINE